MPDFMFPMNEVITSPQPNTAVEVLAMNPRRKRAIFVNDSDTKIYISKTSITGIAGSNKGIPLYPNGGSYEEVACWANDERGNPRLFAYTGPWYAYSGAASKTLQVVEDA